MREFNLMSIFSTFTFLFLISSFVLFGQNCNIKMDAITQNNIIGDRSEKVAVKPEIELINIHLTDVLLPEDWETNNKKHRSVTGKKLHCATFRAGEIITGTFLIAGAFLSSSGNESSLSSKQQSLLLDYTIACVGGIAIGFELLHIGNKYENDHPVRFGLYENGRQIGIACKF